MQTSFTLAQLADPAIADADKILRACVHCGFCTATCPTYVLLGDERDSPRGRIYMIKDMLERGRPADAATVTHVDRCLSCLACMTTCPSGVHYMHLVDQARGHIEKTFRRPWADRAMRRILARVLPSRMLFRLALAGAQMARIAVPILPRRLRPLLALAPRRVPSRSWTDRAQIVPAAAPRVKRVALLTGCAQSVLDPGITEAAVRLLTRHGVEIAIARGAECCGALVHHMGLTGRAHAQAARAIEAWLAGPDLDAIVVTTSGCGTVVKDYGHMFAHDPALAEKAARVSALAMDITEFLSVHGPALGLAPKAPEKLAIAYHAACSLQHGQGVRTEPKALLVQAGFSVREPLEAHLCCGSAGTYNILQPALAGQLRERKVASLSALKPDAIAAGNIGCLAQIGAGTGIPVVHTVELLDWATGGPKPAALGG